MFNRVQSSGRLSTVRFAFWGLAITLFVCLPASAQTEPAPVDSMMSYDLAEIVVNEAGVFTTEPGTINKIALAGIARHNAIAVSDIAREIPAAHIQTNSRGESLIYLRNAGERQIALFFNGALLNIPWDNRVNLDLIPSSVIGGVTVSKGVPSVLYGANAVGGAINITSRAIDYEGAVTEVEGRAGAHGTWNGTVTHILSHRGFHFTGSLGYSTREGVSIPSDVNLSFSQPDNDIRTNTDRDILNGFAQGGYRFGNGAEVGLSYLMIDGDFGVAPEGHLDPQLSQVRFWRYPHWHNSILVLNGSAPLKGTAIVRGALWGNWFGQDIDSFTSVDYVELEERQQDCDKTFGSRLIMLKELGQGQISLNWNGLISTHEELVLGTDETGLPVRTPGMEPDLYSQFVYSAGLEYTFPLTVSSRLSLGGSLDGFTAPDTGDKPAFDPLVDYGISTGIQIRLSESVLVRASAGRKVRFPTLRELFGVALNRFLLNPDLMPESSFVYETALAARGDLFSGEIVGFFQRTFDTIDQQNVEVNGQRLRQRINLDGSRVWGVELAGQMHQLRGWLVDGHFTWMNPRAYVEESTAPLTEKPALLGSLNVTYRHASGVSASAFGVLTGRAYGRNEENEFESLASSFELDLKGAYRFNMERIDVHAELFLRVDNVFDVTTLPQLGLPGSGRFVSTGLNLTL